uniref:Glucose-methanol-choline oxidoreductase N-terminal domain-containing protein n=1 Tax=Parascaris equorum TaxID=6256 RepID=A0A914RFW2_PAREQ
MSKTQRRARKNCNYTMNSIPFKRDVKTLTIRREFAWEAGIAVRSPRCRFYHTSAQKNLNDRVIYWPRGRVWGGNSSLNTMVYARGHPFDYDYWDEIGASGWSYK